jgi:UDP-N-acetylmuramate dehydrogenase
MAASNRPTRPEAGIEWVENAPLEGLNSMGLRAATRLLATVKSEEALVHFLEWAAAAGEEFVVLGGGTNVVFGDERLDLAILRLGGEFAEFAVEGDRIKAGAAVPLGRLVRAAMEAGLAGLEQAWHIPGTLGGALIGNAGIPGWEIGDVVEWVEAFDRAGRKRRFAASDLKFGYRQSNLAGEVVARASLALEIEDPGRIADRIEQTRALRNRQPRGARSAGCIFKNPPGDAAGRLIDAAGLKGLRRGGAVVSPDHANFIVAESGATGKDVLALIDEIRHGVREKFGIELETEVRILRSTTG